MFSLNVPKSTLFIAGAAFGFGLFVAAISASAATSTTTLWSFGKVPDGSDPTAELTADPTNTGVFYGTTESGGDFGQGTVFELSQVKGSWTVTVLHSFNGNDGWHPLGKLAIDGKGNLFGTTVGGGDNGQGEVFEVSPPADKNSDWTYQGIYAFSGGSDGASPEAGPVFDKDGNLFGTTDWGGDPNNPNGVVYKMSPKKGGGWTFNTLHTFNFTNGQQPAAPVVIDANGVVYGTTVFGGRYGNGVVYALSPKKNGSYNFERLHNFHGTPAGGSNPTAPLTIDSNGTLYGTVRAGGTNCGGFGCGDVFALVPGKGRYMYALLHHFNGNDGTTPLAGLLLHDGKLFGTTSGGGAHHNGTIFAVTPGGTFETVYDFGDSPDGALPEAGLIEDGNGNLLGTTEAGGDNGNGTIFSITP